MNSTLRGDWWVFVGPNLFGRKESGVLLDWSNEFDPTGGLVGFCRAEFIRPQGVGRAVGLVE